MVTFNVNGFFDLAVVYCSSNLYVTTVYIGKLRSDKPSASNSVPDLLLLFAYLEFMPPDVGSRYDCNSEGYFSTLSFGSI